jgi:hypothetical protein
MTFDEELKELIESGLPFDQLERAVAELHRRHGRDVPPPVQGTVTLTEPDDSFGRRPH